MSNIQDSAENLIFKRIFLIFWTNVNQPNTKSFKKKGGSNTPRGWGEEERVAALKLLAPGSITSPFVNTRRPK